MFVAELFKGVPQLKYTPSGFDGWKKHLEPPYTRLECLIFINIYKLTNFLSNLDGDVYFESVNCGANLGHMTFHGWVFRKIWGKLGMIVVAGAPKLAKTKVDVFLLF